MRKYRDAVLLGSGLVFMGYEVFLYRGPERWGLMMLYAGLLGLPVFLRADEREHGPAPKGPPIKKDGTTEP